MPKYLFRKPETPNLADPQIQRHFIEEAHSSNELIRKELDVNLVAQNLLLKRIGLMRSFAGELPSSDPQYSMLLVQIQMDEVELSELKSRERSLLDNQRNP